MYLYATNVPKDALVFKLSLKDLNRTYLARQHLLAPADLSPLSMVEHLCALQSQLPNPPYLALWARLATFERASLTDALHGGQVLRVPWLRSTLHLVSSADYARFRPHVLPALVKGLRSFHGRNLTGTDPEQVAQAAVPYLTEAPRTMGDLKNHLIPQFAGVDGEALNYAVRTYLPLAQVPPGGTWGSGALAKYALVPANPSDASPLEQFFVRYLRAYGPASVMDFQTWAGLTNLQKPLAPLRDRLTVYLADDGRELWDVPGGTLVDGTAPAPVRLLPEYDNAVIAHQDRTRILPEADRTKVFLSAARVLGTVLVGGFVAGVWKLERPTKKRLSVVIEPFGAWAPSDRAAVQDEAARLAHWVDGEAERAVLIRD
jgi:hypothetical protein